MKPAEEIERFVKHISFRASRAMDEDLWANIARAGDGRTEELAPDRRDIRRFIMRMSTTRIAIVALVCIGAGAISAVGVTIGRVYYWGTSDDGTHHIFYSKGASGEGFTTMDANGRTVEQTQTDLEEMQNLSQQDKRELVRVIEIIVDGTCQMRIHVNRYQLSDGRTREMGEGVDFVYDDTPQWRQFKAQLDELRRLQKAGPGEDAGTYEKTVKGRVFSFKQERYVLSDGTEMVRAVGTPKAGQ